jgi:iron complex outermembrane receptor protein
MRVRVVVLLLLSLGTATAWAQDSREQAKRHFANGESLFRAGDYKSAIAEFKAADRLVTSPILAFNIGLCHEKLGEPEQAISLYKTYLERRPDAPNRAQVEGRIARLEGELARSKSTADLYQELDDSPPAGSGSVDSVPGASGVPETGTPPPPGAAEEDPFMRRIPSRSGGSPSGSVVGSVGPPPPGEAEPAGAPRPPPEGPPPSGSEPPQKSKPLYKEWWFWVVVGVSAIILIDIATTDNEGSQDQPAATATGATLFTF